MKLASASGSKVRQVCRSCQLVPQRIRRSQGVCILTFRSGFNGCVEEIETTGAVFNVYDSLQEMPQCIAFQVCIYVLHLFDVDDMLDCYLRFDVFGHDLCDWQILPHALLRQRH